MQRPSDLLEEESVRLTEEINTTMASLKVHYDDPKSRGCNIEDVTRYDPTSQRPNSQQRNAQTIQQVVHLLGELSQK